MRARVGVQVDGLCYTVVKGAKMPPSWYDALCVESDALDIARYLSAC